MTVRMWTQAILCPTMFAYCDQYVLSWPIKDLNAIQEPS